MQEETSDPIQQLIDDLIQTAGIRDNKKLIREILTNGVGLGQDGTERLNLKITAAAIEEMRNAYRLFAPHAATPKVTVFGSARTQLDDPLWQLTRGLAEDLAERGWMVVTGAGPGIMEAAARGAGAQRSLGVSIRLPFEEQPNEVFTLDEHHVSMKYFFTRKLMLVKESHGFICLPGGFGTMDEVFELLTLQQTGKMVPVPIVLLDREDGTYWRGFHRFIIDELERTGMITRGDMDRVTITDDPEVAAQAVTGFWRNYDSIRWFSDTLVFRLRSAPTDEEIEQLNRDFAHLVAKGAIERAHTRPIEVRENDVPDLPRLQFVPLQRQVGELFRFIAALNNLATAPDEALIPDHGKTKA